MGFHHAAFLGESIPWAGGQAVVAPINAIADERAELDWDGAFKLDGQIGDTATGIELERGGDGVGRAGSQATCAGTAAIVFGFVRSEFERGDDFGKENPVAEASTDKIGVLADEAKAGALSKIAFQEWPGVDIPE